MKKILIATGGTGGHIYPALAFAEEVKRLYPDCVIQFIGSDDRMESTLIPQKGYAFTGIHVSGMNGGIRRKIKSAFSILKAKGEMKKLLRKERPEACIGFGNYISVPLILAAHSLHIPTMISEQNSFAGKANLMLAKVADAIEVAYEGNLKQFDPGKTRVLGNPQATAAARTNVDVEELKQYGIDPEKPLLFFMMGSLGSSSVSAVVDQVCMVLDKDVQVLIAKGKSNEHEFQCKRENVHIVPFVNGSMALEACTVAVCRAGATTLCELASTGCASILIPSPFVPNNHQVYNAMELVKRDAAVMIEEKDLNKDSLQMSIEDLLKNEDRLETLRKNARAMATPDAATQMVQWLEELIQNGKVS